MPDGTPSLFRRRVISLFASESVRLKDENMASERPFISKAHWPRPRGGFPMGADITDVFKFEKIFDKLHRWVYVKGEGVML